MGNLAKALVVLALGGSAAAHEATSQRRHLHATAANMQPSSEVAIDHILDRGEDAIKGHKGHHVNKKAAAMNSAGTGGVTEAQKERMKSMGEHDVKVDMKKVAETPYERLGDGSGGKGKVDRVVKDAEKETKLEKKMKKAALKGGVKKAEELAKKAEEKNPADLVAIEAEEKHVKDLVHLKKKEKKGKDTYEAEAKLERDNRSMNQDALTIHECDTVKQQVAFLVPTTEDQLERSIGLLLSFERMGNGPYGDIKFIFQSSETVEAFSAEIPKLFRKWNVTDTSARKLMVELKENAIVHGPSEMPDMARHMALKDPEANARFLKACKRLHALAYVLDTQPCDYKYAVFATTEGRFLPTVKGKGKKEGGLHLPTALGGKASGAPAPKAPNKVVASMTGRRRLLKKPKAAASDDDGGAPSSTSSTGYPAAAAAAAPKSAASAATDDVADAAKKEKKAKKVKGPKKKAKELGAATGGESPVSSASGGSAPAADLSAAKNSGLMGRLDAAAAKTTIYGQNCNGTSGVDTPAMKAARKRMENNALVFAGGDTDSPRYVRIKSATKNFDLFTLQAQLPVVDVKDKAGKFLLEIFRASGATPAKGSSNFKGLVSATINKIPEGVAMDFSDVLLYQYYLLLRGGFQLRDATQQIPGLPACAEAAPLLDASVAIKDKKVMRSFQQKVGPLMVKKGFEGLGAFQKQPPVLEYDRPAFDFTDGQSIF